MNQTEKVSNGKIHEFISNNIELSINILLAQRKRIDRRRKELLRFSLKYS